MCFNFVKKCVAGSLGVLLAVSMYSAKLNAAGPDNSQKVKDSMAMLKDQLNKLGTPKVEGTEDVAGKKVPGLLFGTKKINSNYEVVDAVKKKMGGTATVFVKSGDEFIRVSTNVLKDDGNRAIGTELAKNAALEAIKKGEAYYGTVEILGKPYDTGYEPIKVGSEVVGIYYVGYKK